MPYQYSITGWVQTLPVPDPAVTSWSELQGKPTTFPPSEHTHTVPDITGLTAALAAKADSAATTAALAVKADTASLAVVATTGAYADLSGKPAIPPPLPDQTGNAGKALVTDGAAVSWQAVDTGSGGGGAGGGWVIAHNPVTGWPVRADDDVAAVFTGGVAPIDPPPGKTGDVWLPDRLIAEFPPMLACYMTGGIIRIDGSGTRTTILDGAVAYGLAADDAGRVYANIVDAAQIELSRLVRIDPDGTVTDLATGVASYSLAVDPASGELWMPNVIAEGGPSTLMHVAADGVVSTVETGMAGLLSVGRNPATGELFICGSGGVARVNGDGTHTVLAGNARASGGLSVDPASGDLYLVNLVSDPVAARIAADGSGVTDIGAVQAIGAAYDPMRRCLWAAPWTGGLARIGLDGQATLFGADIFAAVTLLTEAGV